MRELTKSTLSAGLAMSLFGMQMMMNVFRRAQPGEPNPTQEGIDAVTQAMVDNTGPMLRETFQAGNKVQRQMVDLTFELLTLAPLRPAGGMLTMSGATQQVADRLRKWMGGMGAGRDPGGDCAGSASHRPSGQDTPPPTNASAGNHAGQWWGPVNDQS